MPQAGIFETRACNAWDGPARMAVGLKPLMLSPGRIQDFRRCVCVGGGGGRDHKQFGVSFNMGTWKF